MGTVLQMRAVSTGGDENALAAVDVPQNGDLLGVEWSVRTDFDTDGDQVTWQLSFGSTVSIANDARQVISNITTGFQTVLTAVGVAIGLANRYTPLPDIPVGMGERLYLHATGAAAVPSVAMALLHFSFDLDKVATRRR